MIAGTLLYIAYRRYQGLPLKETVKVETLTPLGVEEVEYKSILVAFDDDDPFSNEAVATAKALAARHPRRAIHVVSLVAVPANLPLDAPLEERERAAQTKIEQAKLICGRRVTGHTERVPRAVGSGDRRRGAHDRRRRAGDALRYRNGAPLYGRALQTVLAKRPCRVIVAANPTGQADGVAVPRITEAVRG